jgi:cytochrome c biogenesis protein CcmG/thiol:disulfide interchange protein DsbE
MRASLRIHLAAMMLVAAGCANETAGRAPEVGKAAPSFTATDLEGKHVSLDSLEGRVVLVNSWATWCGPCRAEIPLLDSLHRQYQAQGFSVIGVSVDEHGMAADVRSFARELGMTYPVWLDPEQRFSIVFAASGVPETFLIDRAGVIRFRHSGALVPADTSLINAIRRSLGDS